MTKYRTPIKKNIKNINRDEDDFTSKSIKYISDYINNVSI